MTETEPTPQNRSEKIKTALQSSWKAISLIILFFLSIYFFVRFLIIPYTISLDDSPDNPNSVANKAMISRFSNELELKHDQAIKVFKIFRVWSVKNEHLTYSLDSLNLLFEQTKTINDTLKSEAILLQIIDAELKLNANTSDFYNEVQTILTKEQTAKLFKFVKERKNEP